MSYLKSRLKNKSSLEIILALSITLGLLNFGLAAGSLIFYDYDLDYSEGFVVENTENLMETGSLYSEPTLENGFKAVKYTPVYYFLMAGLGYFTGLELLTGRIINFLSSLGVTFLIFLIIKEISGNKNYLIPLIFLIPYLTIFTAFTIRTDMVALLFSLGGIYLALKKHILPSSMLFLAGFLTKQSFVAGFLAVSVYLLLKPGIAKQIELLQERSFKKLYNTNRDLIRLNIFYFTGLLTSLVLLHLWSPHALQNIFLANVAGFEVRWDLINWIHFTFLPVFGLTLYYIYMFKDRLLGSYFLFATALMVFQMLRGGAWVYSAIEPFAITVICTGILYTHLESLKKKLNYILIAQLLIFLLAPMISGNVFDIQEMPDYNAGADEDIVSYIKASNSSIYVEHIGYELGITEDYSPETWGFYEQYAAGNINKTEVVQHFEKRNYEYIITYNRIDKLPVEDYIEDNYEIVDRVERRDMILNTENWRVYRWED